MDEVLDKHGLPFRQELEAELDLGDYDDQEVLRYLLEKIGGRLSHFIGVLDNVVQPDSTFTSMFEYESFSEDERKRAFKLYKELMHAHRGYLQTDLEFSEENAAAFIKEFWSAWPGLKRELSGIVSRMKDSWKGDRRMKMELGYLG